MVNFKEIYLFSRFQRGSNISQGGGGPTFSRGGGGGPIAYSLYKPIYVIFQGGSALELVSVAEQAGRRSFLGHIICSQFY